MVTLFKNGSQFAASFVLAALALSFSLSLANADDVPPAPEQPSLDDELLKQLDDSLEGKPARKPDHRHNHKAPAVSDATDAEKPAAAPAPAGPSKPSKPSTDDELFKELDAGEEPSLRTKKEQPGEELGPNADPLTRIGTKMRQAVTLIDREQLSEHTTLLQDEIVRDIDDLIKKQKKKMQQQQQQASSLSQRNSQQSKVRPQGKNAQQRRPQQGGGGEQTAAKRPEESTERLGKNQQQRAQLDPAAQEELLKRVWGTLPEKDREQMRQAAAEEFLPDYENLIIRYFRQLAEEDSQ